MATIDVINKLNLSDEKKLKLLALYVDSLLVGHFRDTDLQDFIDDVFNEEQQDSGTCCPAGPPGEQGEPGIPDDEDIKTRYDELLEPLEDLGSLAAVPDDAHLIKIPFPRHQQEKWIYVMGAPDDLELPPPGTTIFSIPVRVLLWANMDCQVGLDLVNAEGGPFIDAYLEIDEDIIYEHTPIRDTEFLEGRTSINMQYDDQTYEFKIETDDLITVVE